MSWSTYDPLTELASVSLDSMENATMSAVRKPIMPKPPQTRDKVLVILQEQCKQCGLCIEFCPKNVLCYTDTYNRKGYYPVTACDIDACVNCEFCELICPDLAIFLADRDEAKKAYDAGSIDEGTVIPEFDQEAAKKKEATK
jgi:2-oxoglutarate ferredoxin oxidoreductase subunit delta